MLARERADVTFACVGSGPAPYAAELRQLAGELGLRDRVRWIGALDDMPAAYSAFDIATLCSAFGEGFPNVIGEAMACKRPCVVTPSGDSALVVGDTGLVVNARDPRALAEGWKEILTIVQQHTDTLGERARTRILLEFSKELLIERTEIAFSLL